MVMRRGKRGPLEGGSRYGFLFENEDGVQCHECGLMYRHLGQHAHRLHGLSPDAYKARWGLKRSNGLISGSFRAVVAKNGRRLSAQYPEYLSNPIADKQLWNSGRRRGTESSKAVRREHLELLAQYRAKARSA